MRRQGRPRSLAPELVARIVTEHAAGASLGAIARRLDAEGHAPARGGTRWYRSTVRAVLQSALLDSRHAEDQVDGHRTAAASTSQGATEPHQPPTAPGGIIGRQGELAELAGLLCANRLLTLTGPSGIGKTRLAMELCRRASDGRSERAAWVELARIGRASLVPRAVAAALGMSEQSGRPITEILVSYLSPRRLLLVLDNCEHLLPAVQDLAQTLMERCPALTILATSQQALGIAGEHAHPVPPLSLLGFEGAPAGLPGSPAVRLFCERAADARRGFRLTADIAPAVEEICRRLDGIPLAIELAAVRVSVMTPAEIASRLGDRFDLLTEEAPGGARRRHTLRAALDWSCELLRPEERTLLWRLSVFSGGWSLDAAEAVCGEGLPEDQLVIDSIAALVARSLVVADTSGERARYSMLETIRLHAAERLEETGEQAALRSRHLGWCLALSDAADVALSGPDQLAWLGRLDLEHDNLRAALAHATAVSDAESAVRLAGALSLYWRVRGHFREGRGWLESALALGEAGDLRHRARALWGLGFLAVMLTDLTAATTALEHALLLARDAADIPAQARALLLLGNVSGLTDPSREPVLLEESVGLARQAQDAWCLGHSLAMLGWALMRRGKVAAALPALRECLVVSRRNREPQSLRLGLNVMGHLAMSQREFHAAEDLLTEGLGVARLLGEPFDIAAGLHSLGQLATLRGREAEARGLFHEALAFARLAAVPLFIESALCELGHLALDADDAAAARGLFEESAGAMREAGLAGMFSLRGLGEVAIAEGKYDAAREHLDQALVLATTQGERPTVARIRAAMGALSRAMGDLDAAAGHHHAAILMRRDLGDSWDLPQSLEALGGLAAQDGRAEHAARLLAAAQSMRDAIDHARPRSCQAEFDADVALARRGTARFSEAWAQGASLTAVEAVELATTGGGAGHRPQVGWPSLTPAQQRVALLVAEGLTNAQIAERLFISRYTVEGHLSQVFGKLGIRSRSQLVRESLRRSVRNG